MADASPHSAGSQSRFIGDLKAYGFIVPQCEAKPYNPAKKRGFVALSNEAI